MGTVRFRLTMIATSVVLVVLAVAGWAITVQHRRVLMEQLVENLSSQADTLAEGYSASANPLLGPIGDDDTVARIVAPGGVVLAATGKQVPALPDPVLSPVVIGPFGPEQVRYQVVTRPLADETVVQIAAPLDDIDQGLTALSQSLIVAVLTATGLLMAAVWWLIGRTLRPVERIRAEVAQITASDLDRRVPQPGSNDEIGRLASTMNAMLDRLADGSDRQQRFVADASHELRTPLTRMRSELEVDLAHPETANPVATARSLLDEVEALQRLTDDLLLIAQSEASGAASARQRFDLAELIAEETKGLVGRNLVLDRSGLTSVDVVADPRAMRRVVRNLVDNGVRHARSRLAFSLLEAAGEAILTVTDDGDGIPPGDRQRVFDRFVRIDHARSSQDGGAGLGLAIVRQLVEAQGGSVSVDPDYEEGARLVVRLPIANPD